MLKTVGLSYESNTKLNKVQILAEQMKWNLGYLVPIDKWKTLIVELGTGLVNVKNL